MDWELYCVHILLFKLFLLTAFENLLVSTQCLLCLLHRANEEEQEQQRARPARRTRKRWHEFTASLSDRIIRRMFRMTRESFSRLCKKIERKVGVETFKSEQYLRTRPRPRTAEATDFLGGAISGEMKVALFLRMMAGGSYLDLLFAYGMGTSAVHRIYKDVGKWVNKTLEFPLPKILKMPPNQRESALRKIAAGFAALSKGMLYGFIGMLDGLAVRIPRPCDPDIIDPGNYFCRKQFYALNAQALVDAHKRFLWASTVHQGSAHDSLAFSQTDLYKDLEKLAEWLFEKGFFIGGDSAYNLLSWLIIPYDNVSCTGDIKDVYNFWHSNGRIRVECAFGELIMCWGVFWKRLGFKLDDVGDIISAAMLLHNFLIDERERSDNLKASDRTYFSTFSISNIIDDSEISDDEFPMALVTDNGEPKRGGRPTASQIESKQRGMKIREEMALRLAEAGINRPLGAQTKRNAYGLVYDVSN